MALGWPTGPGSAMLVLVRSNPEAQVEDTPRQTLTGGWRGPTFRASHVDVIWPVGSSQVVRTALVDAGWCGTGEFVPARKGGAMPDQEQGALFPNTSLPDEFAGYRGPTACKIGRAHV